MQPHSTLCGGKAIGSQARPAETAGHRELQGDPATSGTSLGVAGSKRPASIATGQRWHQAGLVSPEAKLPPSFQIDSKALPGPTHPPTHAGREGGDSESAAGWPCPIAGDPVITATASVRENLKTGEPSSLRGSGRSRRACHSTLDGGVSEGW